MMTRWSATLGLTVLLVGSARADDKPANKTLLKQAVEAANKDDFAQAIKLTEQFVKTAPEDREGLYLLGILAAGRADESKEKLDKIALLHKSADAFARLSARYKDLTLTESTRSADSRIGEARAQALEGKADAALATIQQALTAGFDNLEAIDSEDDLLPVRKLAGFKDAVTRGIKDGVTRDLAANKSFPFDFDLKDVDDKAVKLASYKGKVTIVDVWGTWCPPCRAEIPHFVELYREYKVRGLEIVGINCNEEGTPAEVKKTINEFLQEQKVEYKCVLNDDKTESKIPEFQGYPTTLFLDRTGKVRLSRVGYTSKARLEAIVASLLAEKGL